MGPRKGTGQCGWNPAEDTSMRRGARTNDGVRRRRLSRQSVVPHTSRDVHSDVEPDGRLRIMRALQCDAVLRGSQDHESRSQDHREMADIGIERREAIPNLSATSGFARTTMLIWTGVVSETI